MKTIGLIGGTSWVSTADYYLRAKHVSGNYPKNSTVILQLKHLQQL